MPACRLRAGPDPTGNQRMQGLLGRHRDRAPRCLGIALQQDAFGLARVEPGRSTCHAPLDEEALEKVVRRDRLRRHAAHLVLAAGDYRLLPTERPDVPEADLREALRWQIADLVDFDVTDAVLEFCPMGDGENHHGRSMVFAVAARRLATLGFPNRLQRIFSGSSANVITIATSRLFLSARGRSVGG